MKRPSPLEGFFGTQRVNDLASDIVARLYTPVKRCYENESVRRGQTPPSRFGLSTDINFY